MKIKRHQVGGIVYSPLHSSQQAQTTSSETKSEKISGTIKKEIIDILKENGIPSDVDAFLTKANSFLNGSLSLSSKSLFGGTDDDYDLSDLIKIQKMANDVKWNKGLYDNAVKNLDAEDAWGEIALDSRGHMYVADSEGNISTVEASKFDIEKQIALTNEQMLAYRERVGTFAMNSGILNNMSGTVGMKTVQDYLIGLTEKLGTSTLQGYGSKEQNQIINGIKELMEGGPDGYYKITNKTQGSDVKLALKYLHNQLTPQMKKTLNATIAAEGGNPTTDTLKFIALILNQNIDSEQKVDFDSSATKSAGLDSESKAATVKQTLAERYATGNGFSAPEWFPIMSSGQNTPMYVSAQNLGPILQKDEKSLMGDSNLETLLNEAYGIGAQVDRSSITFGDVAISWDDASKLMYEGDSNFYRVHLPAKKDASGRIRPDFELQKTIDSINKELKGMTPGQIKSAIADIPGVTFNEQTGLVEAKHTHVFYTFSAIASDDTLGNLNGSQYVHRLSNQEDRQKKNKYNNAIKYRTSARGKNAEETGNSRTDWWWGYKFYEGNVFIPLNDSMLSASIYNDQLVPKSTYMNMSAKSQARQEYEQKQMATEELIQSGKLRLNF